MKYLHDYWNDPKLTESEKYLRDYILNKRYLDKSDDEDEDENENEEIDDKKSSTTANVEDGKVKPIDFVEFSEEEDIIENQEEFERKYNFRYEDPDPEFIKSYPRTVADTMRRKDTKRKEKREEYKQRKEAEKLKKKEEIKRLKNLKKKEIMNKINKIKRVTGTDNLQLDLDDLEEDFDPDKYEKKMQKLFDDKYYQQKDPLINSDNENDDDKPVFTDDDEEDLKCMFITCFYKISQSKITFVN
jgi:protein KRI1